MIRTGPPVLIANPDVRARLWMVDALRERYAIHTPGPGETPLQATRRIQPRVVLLAIPRGRSSEATRMCRMIKTDSSTPPLVGLLDPVSRLRNPRRHLSAALADGYLGGGVDVEGVCAFLVQLLNGQQPIMIESGKDGILKRVFMKFS